MKSNQSSKKATSESRRGSSGSPEKEQSGKKTQSNINSSKK